MASAPHSSGRASVHHLLQVLVRKDVPMSARSLPPRTFTPCALHRSSSLAQDFRCARTSFSFPVLNGAPESSVGQVHLQEHLDVCEEAAGRRKADRRPRATR